MGNSILGVILVSAIVLYCFLVRFRTVSSDPREPPIVPPRIPVIGHVIGLIRNGGAYYTKLRFVCVKGIALVR